MTLTISDAAGQSRKAEATVVVNNQAHVRGLECSRPGDAGWCWQFPQALYGAELTDMAFADDKIGWIGTADGLIYKTGDGGATWSKVFSMPGKGVYSLGLSADGSKLWALSTGDSKDLYLTEDGGLHWQLMQSFANNSGGGVAEQVHLIDAQRLAVSGWFGSQTWVSEDAGKTWRVVVVGVGNTNRIALAPDGALWTKTARSLDLGRTWQSLASQPAALRTSPLFKPVPNGTDGFGSLVVPLDAQTALLPVVAQSSIGNLYIEGFLLTQDGGQSWTPRNGLLLDFRAGQIDRQLGRLEFDRRGRIWALGQGMVARSSDQGGTWARIDSPTYSGAGEIGLVEDRAATASTIAGLYWYLPGMGGRTSYFSRFTRDDFASLESPAAWQDVGRPLRMQTLPSGRLITLFPRLILESLDRGTSWHGLLKDSRFEPDKKVSGLLMWDELRGIDLSASAKTSDGGRSWQPFDPSERPPSGSWGANVIQQLGQTTWTNSGGALVSTGDQGKTWTMVPELTRLVSWFWFFDAQRGLALQNNRLRKTEDGGKTWTEGVLDESIYGGGLQFVSPALGLRWDAQNPQKFLYRTSDGGQSWQRADLPQDADYSYWVQAALMLDEFNGWVIAGAHPDIGASRGALFRTVDAGKSWSLHAQLGILDARPKAIAFQDAKTGWVVGEDGLLLATRDGGKNWSRVTLDLARDFDSIYIKDSKTIWIGGPTVRLTTGTGG